MTRTRRAGFTLIELLVVIAILSLLAAILFPAFSTVRRNARKTVCMNNMREIAMAFVMYTADNDEKCPRTQETTACQSSTECIPGYFDWWANSYYQQAMESYMKNGVGGMSNTSGSENSRQTVWFDPSDPDIDTDPYIWGSFRNNGLVTGVASGSIPAISNPSNTIYMALRVANWAGYEVATNPPNCITALPDASGCATMPPANDPPPASDNFWSSDYFDICLNPWSYTCNPEDLSDPYYWSKGKAAPPCELNLPGVPASGDGSCIREYQSIDGRWPAQNEPPRYGDGQPYAFVDGHTKWMPFVETYQSTTNNMWSTNQ